MTTARTYIEGLASQGHYHFDLEEIRRGLATSTAGAKSALARLAKQGMVASPARGFYIIVPPEYRRLGSLPAEQFIPALMKREERPYYVGLLSAAQYHGAAHHRPQELQVFLQKNRRQITCGSVRVSFFARARLKDVPTQEINTPRGTVAVSTIEATAIDLVGYERHAGGLDQVATVLHELAEKIDPERLVKAAKSAPISWAQRLGYLLELVDASDKVTALKSYVRATATDVTPLLPSKARGRAEPHKTWHLWVNARVEAEV